MSFHPLSRYIGLYLMDAQTKATKKWKFPSPLEVYKFISEFGLVAGVIRMFPSSLEVDRFISVIQQHLSVKMKPCFRPLSR